MYAIIETGGKQYRVSPGQSIDVASLPGEIGETLDVRNVLLLANDGEVVVGKPTVPGVTVRATVVDQGRGRRITVLKFRRGNRYQRKLGHRQGYTRLLIQDIVTGAAKKDRPKKDRPKKPKVAAKKPVAPAKKVAAPKVSVEELGLPARLANALKDAGLAGAQDLMEADDEKLLGIRGVGPKSVEQVRAALREKGFVQE